MQLGRTSVALSLALVAGACTGTLDAGPRHGRGGSIDDPSDPTSPTICAPQVGTVRARRLTASEHGAIVEDVLGVHVPEDALPADEISAGFAANAETAISDAELTTHLALAESIAHETIASGRVAPCADSACLERFLDDAGTRLYRRRLTTEERTSLVTRATEWRASEGTDRAMEMSIATLLVSPRFLYVIEASTGEPREDGALRLDGPSLASRLAFLLTGRGPDRALLDAAEAGELDTRDGLAVHASRLLDDERSIDATASFLAEWLHVGSVHDEAKAVHASGATWSSDVARSMERDTELVLREIVQREGGLPELFGSNVAYVDARLAPLYGVSAPPAGETTRMELPVRHGILTHPSILSGHAHTSAPSWTLRGLFVREALLCETMQGPPPGTDLSSVPQGGRIDHPVCGSCHRRMEPIGQGFDRFDAWGLPTGVARGGELVSADAEIAGAFADPRELGDRLAHASVVRSCAARHAFRFAHRRLETPEESCTIDRIASEWDASGGDFRSLLLAAATDESFRWAMPQAD